MDAPQAMRRYGRDEIDIDRQLSPASFSLKAKRIGKDPSTVTSDSRVLPPTPTHIMALSLGSRFLASAVRKTSIEIAGSSFSFVTF